MNETFDLEEFTRCLYSYCLALEELGLTEYGIVMDLDYLDLSLDYSYRLRWNVSFLGRLHLHC